MPGKYEVEIYLSSKKRAGLEEKRKNKWEKRKKIKTEEQNKENEEEEKEVAKTWLQCLLFIQEFQWKPSSLILTCKWYYYYYFKECQS